MMILLFSVLDDEQRALVERIFHEHHIHFQRISFNIVKSEETAEDVVSTAFVKIMDNIEKVSNLPCPQMTAFCVTIVKNASIDVLRQLQRSVHIDYWNNISDEDSDDIADECIRNADVHRLTELINQLDTDERNFIHLRYALEMGYREIGELLNISEDAAKKRGQRLVKKLRKLYEEG
jgi:RNA polymerase sigma-70 factor, ECF subfamily